MSKTEISNGKRGGLLKGKPHYDKNGNSLGGIKAVVTDAGGKPVELEGGEVIINKEASKKYWRELSKINQSAGNGVPILPPDGAVMDEDPEEFKDGGNIIEFNPNHLPNKWITEYAESIKKNHPEIWKKGGNIFGNEAFNNLLRVRKRGYWLDSEEWMYIKWRSYVARHKKDFRIEGVVAMLKWCDTVDKGWAYMKNLIKTEIAKGEKKTEKMARGGNTKSEPNSCQVLDKNGNPAIDDKSLRKMEKCILKLPQTKDLNLTANGKYKIPRKKLHKKIIDEFKKNAVCITKGQPIAILMGGSPASGKSSFLKKYRPFLLQDEILKVDADEIRAKLPEYKGFNATQTHQETKDIVNTLISDRNIGVPCDFDLIYDGTMNNVRSYKPLIELLRSRNYKIFIVYMDKVPKEVIMQRMKDRYLKTGRFVPAEVVDDFFQKGKSAFEELKPLVDGYMVVDGSNQEYDIIERGGMQLPKDRAYSKLGEKISAEELEKIEYKDGGNIDKKDSVELDIPLMIRIMELAREDIKSDKELHDVAERLIEIRDKGVLTMEDYDFIANLKKKEKFSEIERKYANGGTVLLAPNGKPSNLTPEQHKLVRTPAFKAWFGDWENDPENASKVVDENGEPLVCYHGTDAKFNSFNKNFIGSNFKLDKIGFFFTSSYNSANMSRPSYPQKSKLRWTDADKINAKSGFIISSFLNIRKPLRINEVNNVIYDSGVSAINTFDHNREVITESILRLKKDGFILKKEGEYLLVATQPNQIKLADGTNTTFDGNNPDIRFETGGTVLLAPNGKPSNLTPEQYKLVRTPEFKAWFGDWENDPENASKVVDENGEPQVVYHGSRSLDDFFVFDSSKGNPSNQGGHYFSNSKPFALKFGKNIKELFLKIENPLYDGFDGSGAVMSPSQYRDGGIFTKRNSDKYAEKGTKEYIVFNSNQIKLADGTNTTFDGNNPDIRFETGGTVLLAPNGKPSNLTPEQYKLVRTPEFKAWFGDWENDPENASKVVDENGEPLVVYHGTNYQFNEFRTTNNKSGEGSYFSRDKNTALGYQDPYSKESRTNEYFINLRNPYLHKDSLVGYVKSRKEGYDGEIGYGWQGIKNYEIVVFEPNQIKLADGTNTTFDGNNPDIRFENGGEITNYTEFYDNLEIKDGSIYIGQKFSDVFPFLRRRKTPNDFRIMVNQYYGVLDRLRKDNYSSPTQKQRDLNKLWRKRDIEQKKYLSRFYLDGIGTIIEFRASNYNDSNQDVKFETGGTILLAPNGKPSNLTTEQYKLVRTPEFKAWFGDWENDPENASRVVDENGEPLVVYRGYPKKRKFPFVFEYKYKMFGKSGVAGREKNDFAFYFTNLKKVAEKYGENFAEGEPFVIKEYFLNIRNIFKAYKRKNQYEITFKELYDLANKTGNKIYELNADGEVELFWQKNEKGEYEMLPREYFNHTDIRDKYFNSEPQEIFSYFVDWDKKSSNQFFWANYLRRNLKYDGLVFYERTHNQILNPDRDKNDYHSIAKPWVLPLFDDEFSKTYAVFESNQIKLADGTNTTFDGNNPDIRFENGGTVDLTSFNKNSKTELKKWDYKHLKTNEEKRKAITFLYAMEYYAKNNIIPLSEPDNEGSIYWQIVSLNDKEYNISFYLSFHDFDNPLKITEAEVTFYDENYNELDNSDIQYKRGGRTVAQTPAPKKDQVYGSQRNAPKSSKDSVSAEEIKFDARTLETIENKVREHNEDNPTVKIPVATAKAVVRRGMGAYSKSHRPTISGGQPNSRVAWGLARLNAFLYKAVNGKSKSGKYSQDNDLLEELGIAYEKFENGGNMSSDDKVIKAKALLKKSFDYLVDDLELLGKGANGMAFLTVIDNEMWVAKYTRSTTEFWLSQMAMVSNPPHIVTIKDVKELSNNYEYGIIHKYTDNEGVPNKAVWNIAIGIKFKEYLEAQKSVPPKEKEYVRNLAIKLSSEVQDYFGGITIDTSNANWGYEDGKLVLFDIDGNVKKSQYEEWMQKYSVNNTKMATGGLIAPNGKPSKLSPKLYEIVRTPEFKAWFGDWENDPENASKVVDENGEPLVVYREIQPNDTKYFNTELQNALQSIKWETNLTEILTTKSASLAKIGDKVENGKKRGVITDITDGIFKIKYEDDTVSSSTAFGITFYGEATAKNILAAFLNIRILGDFSNALSHSFANLRDSGILLKSFGGKTYFTFRSYQAKIADGTNTTFDSRNPDIRFKDGGLVESNNFKSWFKKSKVVDKKGNPLLVYHGSPDLRGLKENYIFEPRFDGDQSFFFTDNYSMAKSYADPKRAFDYQNAEEGVISLYLSIQNPLIVEAFNQIWRNFETVIDGTKIIGTKKLIEFAKEKGYDGVIVENVRDYYNENDKKTKGGNVYVAFKPNQIKLADGKNTTFDGSNPDIRFKDGGSINNERIDCHRCDWSWKVEDGGDDLYVCHKCGYDNAPYYATKFAGGGGIDINEPFNVNGKTLAERVRILLKQLYPDYKWSVTSSYNKLDVYLLEADFDPFTDLFREQHPDRKYYNINNWDFSEYNRENKAQVTDRALEVFKPIREYIDKFVYNRNANDPYADYSDYNIYEYTYIGKWDKPYVQVAPKAGKRAKTPITPKLAPTPTTELLFKAGDILTYTLDKLDEIEHSEILKNQQKYFEVVKVDEINTSLIEYDKENNKTYVLVPTEAIIKDFIKTTAPDYKVNDWVKVITESALPIREVKIRFSTQSEYSFFKNLYGEQAREKMFLMAFQDWSYTLENNRTYLEPDLIHLISPEPKFKVGDIITYRNTGDKKYKVIEFIEFDNEIQDNIYRIESLSDKTKGKAKEIMMSLVEQKNLDNTFSIQNIVSKTRWSDGLKQSMIADFVNSGYENVTPLIGANVRETTINIQKKVDGFASQKNTYLQADFLAEEIHKLLEAGNTPPAEQDSFLEYLTANNEKATFIPRELEIMNALSLFIQSAKDIEDMDAERYANLLVDMIEKLRPTE